MFWVAVTNLCHKHHQLCQFFAGFIWLPLENLPRWVCSEYSAVETPQCRPEGLLYYFCSCLQVAGQLVFISAGQVGCRLALLEQFSEELHH